MQPASNVNISTYASTPLQTRESAYGGPWTPWRSAGSGSVAVGWEKKIHPASVSNPVQPDGRRARSAWYHSFATTTYSQYNLVTEYDTPWGIRYQYQGMRDMLGSNSVQACFSNISGAVSEVFPYEAEARARTSFLKKLAGSTADLGVALAEMRQTVTMTGNLARDILRGIDASIRAGRGLKRKAVLEILRFGTIPTRRPREAARAYNRRVKRERAVLNKWLETQFGMLPLVNDIHQIGEGLSDLLFEQAAPMVLTIKSGSKFEDSAQQTIAYGSHPVNVRYSCTTEYRCWISADYAIPLSGSRSWNQWGMLNPTVVAWELTQFSWLVDYVFQVGDWLESLTASVGTIPLGGSVSRLARVVDSDAQFLPGTYKVLSPIGRRQVGLNNVGWFQRYLIAEVAPSLRPTVRNKLNLTRLANVLSVLALRAS